MLKLLFFFLLASSPGLSETLLSGAVYFDSQNTFLEVQKLLKEGNEGGLARLFEGDHISDKLTKNMDVVILFSGPNADSPAEFRFPGNPTTYWTYSRYLADLTKPVAASLPSPSPSLSPGANSNFPANLSSSLTSPSIHIPASASPTPAAPAVLMPTPVPSPRPTPTPELKAGVAAVEEDSADRESRPPLHRYRRPRETSSSANEKEEEHVPESAKVWHRVNGHLRWYDKRRLKEVRRVNPVSKVPTPVPASAPRAAPVE